MDKAAPPDGDNFMTRLRDLCGRIARGDYGEMDHLFAITADPAAPPEVRELAEAFGSMAVQIEGREYRLSGMLDELREANRRLEDANRQVTTENVTLRGEVERLSIEIDLARKDREVAAIVETDYFRVLQERATEMRRRHAGGAGARETDR